MVGYLARPPIANDRLSKLPDGRPALQLKQRWRDGTTHVVFTPHELIEKLIPLIPGPRAHVVRYHGVFGPAAEDRQKIMRDSTRVEYGHGEARAEPAKACEIDASRMPRLGRLPWAVLIKRVFLVDVLECPKCMGRMKILAAVTAPASVRRVLESLGLPSEASRLRPARPPPQTWKVIAVTFS